MTRPVPSAPVPPATARVAAAVPAAAVRSAISWVATASPAAISSLAAIPRATASSDAGSASGAGSAGPLRRHSAGGVGGRAGLLVVVLAAALSCAVAAVAQTADTPVPPAAGAADAPAPATAATPSPVGGPAAPPAPATAAPAVDAVAGPPAAPGSEPLDAARPVARVHLPQDLSPWGMFVASDWVVKAVMIGLAFASVVTWTVALVKSFELAAAGRRLRRDRTALAAMAGLAPATELPLGGEGAALVGAAVDEVRLSAGLSAAGIKERVASRLERVEAAVARTLRLGTGALATIGATAPFVGLFGTVWGIMNAFIGISEAQTTNLAVVAPGIAEALLATALGLVAAIPAVVLYNHFARRIADRRQALADASAAVMRLVSRDLDRRAARGIAAAAE
jgi:biopolymer transport protein ExbB